jgi:hypothetical protein
VFDGHPPYLREKARQLRIDKKLSLLEIAARLALPKTTIFYWISDLPDPEIEYRDTPARARGRAKAARANVARFKALRDAAYRRGWDEYPELTIEPTFRDFVTLFLAEGYKRTRNKVSVANSDPAVLRVCPVTCNDTYLRPRMQAWMDCLREQWLDSAAAGV